ncbi:MAG: hypothetical protein R2698_14830 [Microthrixaceae bacterium]
MSWVSTSWNAAGALDQIVVEFPDGDLIELLLSEIHDVEGARVEEHRMLDEPFEHPAVAALQLATALRGETAGAQPALLVEGARRLLHARWSAVVDQRMVVIAADGDPIPDDARSKTLAQQVLDTGRPIESEGFTVIPLPDRSAALMIGHGSVTLGSTERELLVLIAGLA